MLLTMVGLFFANLKDKSDKNINILVIYNYANSSLFEGLVPLL